MCNLGKMIARENIEKRISTRTKKKNRMPLNLRQNMMKNLRLLIKKQNRF